MNNTDFFASPLQTVHILSVFTSIDTLSHIFYDEKLLSNESMFKPVPIVNSLCEYLYKNNDSPEKIVALGHKLLHKTDLYGSKEDQPIHLQYVEAMMDHIIASTVFSKFVNTFGYLFALVNSTNNLTFSFVKQKIAKDLNRQRYLNEDGTISNLTDLTIKRVTENLIFPLFPQPENDMSIIDVDYMYAQAGLMLTRVAGLNSHNISFAEYITMSQIIEQGVLQDEIDKEGLKIFQLPALLYYSHKEKDSFRSKTITNIITNDTLWTDAFNLLFSHLNVTSERIRKLEEENPAYQFYLAISGYKNRTQLAEDTLRRLCPLENENDYATEVIDYKYFYANYKCKTDQKLLPNINEIFNEQNKYIAHKYFLFEKALIAEAFGDDLIKLVNQTNVMVYPNKILPKMIHGRNWYAVSQKFNSTIDLFEIRLGRQKLHHYALIRNEHNMTLLSTAAGMDSFVGKLNLKNGTTFVTPFLARPLKTPSGKFEELANNLAKLRENEFFKMLEMQGYDPTIGETVIEGLVDLIPFYACFKDFETGIIKGITLNCMLDSLAIIPLAGQVASIGLKFSKTAVKPLLLSLGTTMKTFFRRQSINLALKTGIRVFALEAGKDFSKIITKELFKDIGIALFRTLDPGIELSYMLGKSGVNAILICFSKVGKKISLGRVVQYLKNIKQTFVARVGIFRNRDVFTRSISGSDGYGIKYMHLEHQTVELRRLAGYKFQQPVVLTNSAKRGNQMYQKFDMETGKTTGPELVLKNGILHVKPQPFAVRMKNLKEIGLSGRGQLPSARKAAKSSMIALREEAVQDLKLRMSESAARNTLSQYVLEETGKSPLEFGIDWVSRNKVPDWSINLKLNDVKLYESLRYDEFLEPLSLTEEMAVKRITEFYGDVYARSVIDVCPRELFRSYSQNQLHSTISFTDYYALANWRKTGNSRISFENPEGWQMRGAFCRLTLRQADDPAVILPRKLYKAEGMNFFDYINFSPGKTIVINSFQVFYTELSTPAKSLIENGPLDMSLKVLFEINFGDSPYWAANLERIFPDAERKIAILPGTTFIVEKADLLTINGVLMKKVYMKHVPLALGKSEALTRLTNSVKMLNDWETEFYLKSVLDDFDLNLLQ